MLADVQQHIAATWPVSSSASAAVAPPTGAVYSVQCFPHVRAVRVQSQESQLRLAISSRLTLVIPPHHAPCSRGEFLHPER